MIPDIKIGSKFDAKGFKQAESELSKLTHSVKNLAGAFGVAFGAQALLRYSKQAVKAFAADDKAARVLSGTLKNLGLSYADTKVADFIASLELQYGVVDDLLRPAYQKLLTQTGDFRLAQNLLKTSLDLSAQSGEDLVSVSGDIARAYAGNTRGLMKYNLGFTKAELAAANFDEILAKISDVSSGQAALAADTISGKLLKIDAAAQRASETIGGALVDSFASLVGDGNIDKAISKFDDFIKNATNIFKLSTGALTIEELTKGKKFGFELKKGLTLTDIKTSSNRSGSPAGKGLAAVADSKAKDKLAKEKAAELALLKSKNAETLAALKLTAEQKQLEELKKKFDVDRINLGAALASATTDEERARIASKIAILDGDAKAATSLNKLVDVQIYTADQMYYLAVMAGDAAAMLKYLATGSGSGGAVYGTGTTMGATNLPTGSGNSSSSDMFNSGNMPGTIAPQGGIAGLTINQYVTGFSDAEDIVQKVQESLQVLNARGWSQFKTGALQAL